LARVEPPNRCLQRLQLLVVVSLGSQDGGVPEEIPNLREWHAALNESRRVLVAQIMPVQVDLLKAQSTVGRQVLVGGFPPVRLDVVGPQNRSRPGLLEIPYGFCGLVTEYRELIRFLAAAGV
jgi:hypothetical protein